MVKIAQLNGKPTPDGRYTTAPFFCLLCWQVTLYVVLVLCTSSWGGLPPTQCYIGRARLGWLSRCCCASRSA
jgi:hypothetical protein